MDIYVVSSCWWRDGASVIGAGVRREDAEAIADRHDTSGEGVGSWAPWTEDRHASGLAGWRRDALNADGSVHLSLFQEIVRVPLAGWIGDWPVINPLTEGLAEQVPALMKPKIEGLIDVDPLGVLSAVPRSTELSPQRWAAQAYYLTNLPVTDRDLR
jgi:hypothetical protein